MLITMWVDGTEEHPILTETLFSTFLQAANLLCVHLTASCNLSVGVSKTAALSALLFFFWLVLRS